MTNHQAEPDACAIVQDTPTNLSVSYSHIVRFIQGILECFLAGFCKRLVASDCKARIMRKRVLRGSITSSI